jgi:hypothetical protein
MTEAQETLYYIAENMKMDKSISEDGYKHFQQAIKALEQEPILDKIRGEIEKVFCMSVVTNELRTPMEVKTEILQIIDKYKAESEG